MLVAGMVTFGSCVGDDIDDLQKQIDDLNEHVTELEETQQATLEAQVAALEARIAELVAKNQEQDGKLSDQTQELLDLVAELEAINQEVDANAASIYYGNLLTDADYAAFTEAGASIVTGFVHVSTPEQAAQLNGAKWIGGYVESTVGTIAGLGHIGGNLVINTDDAAVSFEGLKSIGGSLQVSPKSTLESIVLNDLIVHRGELSLIAEGNNSRFNNLNTLSFAGLQMLGGLTLDLYVNAPSQYDVDVAINLNGAPIPGDVEISRVKTAAFQLPDVAGNVYVANCFMTTFEFLGAEINGDVVFEGNTIDEVISQTLTTINGDLMVTNNHAGGDWGQPLVGLKSFSPSSLTSIQGNITFDNNRMLTSILNNVVDIKQYNTEIYINTGKWEEQSYAPVKTREVMALISMTGKPKLINIQGQMAKFTAFTSLVGLPNTVVMQGEISGVNAFNSANRGATLVISPDVEITADAFSGVTSFPTVIIDASKLYERDDNAGLVTDFFSHTATVNRLVLNGGEQAIATGFANASVTSVEVYGGMQDWDKMFAAGNEPTGVKVYDKIYPDIVGDPYTTELYPVESYAGLSTLAGTGIDLLISFNHSAYDISQLLPVATELNSLVIENKTEQAMSWNSTQFANVTTIVGRVKFSGMWDQVVGFDALTSANMLEFSNGVTKVGMANLETLNSTLKINGITANGTIVDMPKLASVGDLFMAVGNIGEAAGAIDIKLPLLASCAKYTMKWQSAGTAPVSISAPLPLLTALEKVDIITYGGDVDLSNVLNNLASFTETTTSFSLVSIAINEGQKLPFLKSFIEGVELSTHVATPDGRSCVTLYVKGADGMNLDLYPEYIDQNGDPVTDWKIKSDMDEVAFIEYIKTNITNAV